MMRTSSRSGLFFVALAAVTPACAEDDDCPVGFRECDQGCVNFATDRTNCGFCRNACGAAETCVIGECTACEAPNAICGNTCADLESSADHCGACDQACGSGVACAIGRCAVPFVALQTGAQDDVQRDVYVVLDGAFDLAQINRTAFTSRRVIDHAVLPDGGLVYVAADETEDVFELFHAAPDGTITKLNPPLVEGGEVLPGVALSADGAKLLYRAEQDVDGQIDLYAVELAHPGEAVRVNSRGVLLGGPPPISRVSRVFALSADGARATYVADQDVVGFDEVFSVDLSTTTPGAPVQLSSPDLATSVFDMKANAAGDLVAYRATLNAGEPQLFVASLDAPGDVTSVLNPLGATYRAEAYQFAPDETRLVYTAGPDGQILNNALFTVSLAADSDFNSELLIDGAQNFIRSFAVSPDGVFVYARRADQVNRLVRTELAAPAEPTPVSDGDDFDHRTADFALSPDGKRIAVRSGGDGAEGGFGERPGTEEPDVDRSRARSIRYIDVSGAAPAPSVLLTPALDPQLNDGVTASYFITDDGRVVYLADHTAQRDEAWLVDVTAPEATTRISPELAGDVTDVTELTPY
jgi:hypothetical protein